MSQQLIQEVHKNSITKKVPEIKPGFTIEVDTIIREGNKQRVQKFKGLVIAITGTGANQVVTIRKISYGVGVEKKLLLHSPNIGAVKVIKTEPTRRSKLYFMRSRVGKNAMRIKKGKATFVTDQDEFMSQDLESEMPMEEVVTSEVAAEVVETPVETTETQA